ncbi:transposase (plasmid) [Komagataeibacter medellinensis NBRC 3288]|uniref:Transposase n=1 Tax=Komagataeibacter medellinensis (strain NBRC 3288 / BCRC 11682 / LMG 1693 / Kondo 51) TaxID=634177 RepID=G2I7Y6_KOMMN|nr:transposase [Komagataeibacter medellinensis NBRC 3288]
MDVDLFWLSDRQFARIAPHLPTDTRGKPRVDDRRVISGIIQIMLSGARWKDAPSAYGPRKTLYNRFQRWAAKGVWARLFEALAQSGGPPAELLIDSSAVKEGQAPGQMEITFRDGSILRFGHDVPPERVERLIMLLRP